MNHNKLAQHLVQDNAIFKMTTTIHNHRYVAHIYYDSSETSPEHIQKLIFSDSLQTINDQGALELTPNRITFNEPIKILDAAQFTDPVKLAKEFKFKKR
jgi:hypothetical protein